MSTLLSPTRLSWLTRNDRSKPDSSPEDKKKRDDAFAAYSLAQDNLRIAEAKYDKVKLAELAHGSKKSQNDLFKRMAGEAGLIEKEIQKNTNSITALETQLKNLRNGSSGDAVVKEFAEDMGVVKRSAKSDQKQDDGKDDGEQKPLDDYFTAITVEVSASSDKQTSHASQSSYSGGVSARWGLSRVDASASYSEAHSKSMSELASSEVKISFECMRVDINRPWLSGELFYDDDLVPGPGVK